MSTPRALAPQMIGRQEQMRELDEHLHRARAGDGRLVLVAGEAGIGKTRLVRTFVDGACQTPGTDALLGHCYDEHPATPYSPFVDAIRILVRARGAEAVIRAAGNWGGDLSRLLPELGPDASAIRGDRDPQSEKRRLFDAILYLLRPGAAQGCRVIVLEDLHWADQTSQELVHYLARAIEHDRILILGTYRSDELHRRHPLNHLIAQLTRERRSHEVRLFPLSRDDLARMLETMLGETPPDAMVHLLHDHTGGNPFFVEEILKALIAQHRLDALIGEMRQGKGGTNVVIPLSLQESILSRTADLDEHSVAVLAYAAVIGRRFDFELLVHLTGMEESALVRAIEALIARQLVVEEAGGEDRYVFRHALTREVIYGDLLGRERRLKHRAVLRALEETHGAALESVADQLAYHSLQARELEKAARYAALAAEQAARMSAWREAVTHYETALELLETDDLRARADLYDRLGEVAYPLGDTNVYLRYWQEAQHLYEQIGDPRKVADVLRRLGQATWERGET